MNAPRVLVAEGDGAARRALAAALENSEMTVTDALDGWAALQAFYRERPDVVVLAAELAGAGGWTVLSRIRELSDVPVLMLADNASEAERVRALRAGADDFAAKPFGRSEMLARIEALLRRAGTAELADVFADDFLRIDHRRHEVEALDAKVELTPTEFRMLAAFCNHAGQALSHAQILSAVWGDDQRDQAEVKLYVSYLRRKLRAAGVEPVETVRGIGYRYKPRTL